MSNSVRPIYNTAGRSGVPLRTAGTGYGNTSGVNQGFNPEMASIVQAKVDCIVEVPAEVADFASDPKFNGIMLGIKKQTNINHIDRRLVDGVCKSILISAPSSETGNRAKLLVETHFRNHIALMKTKARVIKAQNDLFSAQGEVASGMMVDFTIPISVVGLVIGKQGQNIKTIEKETGVKSINVDGKSGKVMVVGPDAASVSNKKSPLYCFLAVLFFYSVASTGASHHLPQTQLSHPF
jgi:hypothetical protein